MLLTSRFWENVCKAVMQGDVAKIVGNGPISSHHDHNGMNWFPNDHRHPVVLVWTLNFFLFGFLMMDGQYVYRLWRGHYRWWWWSNCNVIFHGERHFEIWSPPPPAVSSPQSVANLTILYFHHRPTVSRVTAPSDNGSKILNFKQAPPGDDGQWTYMGTHCDWSETCYRFDY